MQVLRLPHPFDDLLGDKVGKRMGEAHLIDDQDMLIGRNLRAGRDGKYRRKDNE
jgi:hypothetical protein